MTNQASQADSVADRVKLPISFDVAKMREDVKNLNFQDFIYYNSIQLRAPAHMVDTTLPFPPPVEDYADGSWTDWMNTKMLASSPYFMEIIEFFQKHCTVNLVRLLRLAPYAEVKEHTDPTLGLEIHKSMIRLTIPIQGNDQVAFYLNDTIVPMQYGECWYLRLTDRHKIYNNGTTERINLTIDVLPNDWVRSIIMNA